MTSVTLQTIYNCMKTCNLFFTLDMQHAIWQTIMLYDIYYALNLLSVNM